MILIVIEEAREKEPGSGDFKISDFESLTGGSN
jgi:hypothetical protein